jgi:hypothetical protein
MKGRRAARRSDNCAHQSPQSEFAGAEGRELRDDNRGDERINLLFELAGLSESDR